jgi:hypothetical protein
MKRFIPSFILLSGLLFVLAQCGSADAGAKTADDFFTHLQKGEFDQAKNMVDLPVGDDSDLVAAFQAMVNNPVNGKMQSFKKLMGFKTNINNGVTTVQLQYKLIYEKGDRTFDVVIVNRGNGNKIVSVR